ncbi:MAG: DUF3874 domain-containing protein [Bacteroidaceae bacterium]|nr:DUF3874 domain-containing protein [Bacteroidaceae bacterium]
MKKLFETVKAWLRSKVTAMKSEKGRMKSEKVTEKKTSRKQPISVAGEAFPLGGNKKGAALTLPEVQAVLCSKYELRYNLLSEQSEYRERGSVGDDFAPITKRVYMTWLMDIQADGYNYTWIEGVRIAAESLHIPSYHPVTHYFASLPQWDGTDRLRPLMQRLTDDDALVDYLCRWMLALVAQAQGRDEALYANSVAPILISEQQGWHKSTFCRMLLPPELRMFYTDSFDLAAESQCELRLTDCLLINLDEFDRYSSHKQSTLKNLMQMPSLRCRKAYARNATTLPRVASFIGTSNTPRLLTDPTGSRRFLCVELTHMIDVDTPICHAQLYAQCMHLLRNGERHHFSADEVANIELHNRAYRLLPPVEQHFRAHFRHPEEGEQPQLLSAAEIHEYLRKLNPYLMRGVGAQNFGALLREWGFQRVEHHHRRMYKVCKIEHAK